MEGQEPKIMFNKSEIKFEADSFRWNSRLTPQGSKQLTVGILPRSNEASGQPSYWAILLFRCFKALETKAKC